MGNTVSKETSDAIIQGFYVGQSFEALAEMHGVHIATVKRHVKRKGKTAFGKERDEKYVKIIDDYQQGSSIVELEQKYGIRQKTISKLLNEQGIQKRTHAEAVRAGHGSKVNDEAFDVLTEESAYWLGFIMADGGIYGNRLTVRLSVRDVKHLEKLRVFLGSNNGICNDKKIRNFGTTKTAAFAVSSKPIIDTLASHGIVPRKSTKENVLSDVKHDANFWRGMLDGDGCIIYKEDLPLSKSNIGLTGSYTICQQFKSFIQEHIPLFNNSIQPNGENVWAIHAGGNTAKDILQIVYSNPTVYLERKYIKAQGILNKNGPISQGAVER